jgi:cation transport ATPase
MRFVAPFVAQQRASDAQNAILVGTFEDRLDGRMRDASLDWARQNPKKVTQLMWLKLRRMWSPLPNAAEFGGNFTRLTLALTYTPAILLAAVGAWRFRSRGWPLWLLMLPAVYFTCLHVVFVSSIRYRQPAMLVLVILAAAVIVELIVARARMGIGRRDGETE